MKMLMFYTPCFWWEPFAKTLPEAGPAGVRGEERECVTAFLHVEPRDEGSPERTVTRAIKNVKWLAGKFGTRRVVLHYFSHLSADRSAPLPAREVVEAMARRLAEAGYSVKTTPWGWTNRLGMEVAGDSLGRVFVDIPPADSRG